MRNIAIMILGCLICYAETIQFTDKNIMSNIKIIFPTDLKKADVVKPSLPDEQNKKYKDISIKLKVAMAIESDYFQEQIKKQKPGEALPFSDKMRITKEEYDFILNASSMMRLAPVGDAKINVKWISNQCYISFNGLKAFKYIQYNYSDNTIKNEYATCKYQGTIVVSDENNVVGKWKGYKWRYEESNINDKLEINNDTIHNVVSITIGQVEKSKEIFINLSKTSLENGKRSRSDEYVLYKIK